MGPTDRVTGELQRVRVDPLVYARHGRELMGWKSPVYESCYCREDRNTNTNRRQGRFREERYGGSRSV